VLLIKDIKKNGVKVPLLVVKKQSGYYHVIEGHHRTGTAKLLGIEKIKCLVLKEVVE